MLKVYQVKRVDKRSRSGSLHQLIGFILVAIFLLGSSCELVSGRKNNEQEAVTSELKSTDTVMAERIMYPDTSLSGLALALAGLQSGTFVDSTQLNQTAGWKEHVDASNKMWYRTEEKIPYMEKWSELYVPSSKDGSRVLFYPFGGADFLHADVFFPSMDTIIMIGLEPVGELPKEVSLFTNMDISFLNHLRNSLNSILFNSFFQTNQMRLDFNRNMDGNLGAILCFAARRDYLIHSINTVYIQNDGSLGRYSSDAGKGNEIILLKDGKPKVVYYFSLNLMDSPINYEGVWMKGLQENQSALLFFKNTTFKSTYLKAASYLMHGANYSIIRNFILEQSEVVLQDDSGIPFRYFSPSHWKTRVFGKYNGPIPLFASLYQADLRQTYLNTDPLGLPFGIGYKYLPGSSNLQLVHKTSPWRSEDPLKASTISKPNTYSDKNSAPEDKKVVTQRQEPGLSESVNTKVLPASGKDVSEQVSPGDSSTPLEFAGRYVIGCYAVIQESYAKQLVEYLRNKNFESNYLYIPAYEPSGKRMYRVFVGPFSEMADAYNQLSNIQQLIPKAYVVQMP